MLRSAFRLPTYISASKEMARSGSQRDISVLKLIVSGVKALEGISPPKELLERELFIVKGRKR